MSNTAEEIKNIQSTGRVRDRVASFQTTSNSITPEKELPTRTRVKNITAQYLSVATSSRYTLDLIKLDLN